MITSVVVYLGAALAEIAGCFAFWAWLRLDKSAIWLVPGMISLAAFAFLLTRTDSDFAGRAYAAYGGVYIASSLLWLWLVERFSGLPTDDLFRESRSGRPLDHHNNQYFRKLFTSGFYLLSAFYAEINFANAEIIRNNLSVFCGD